MKIAVGALWTLINLDYVVYVWRWTLSLYALHDPDWFREMIPYPGIEKYNTCNSSQVFLLYNNEEGKPKQKIPTANVMHTSKTACDYWD